MVHGFLIAFESCQAIPQLCMEQWSVARLNVLLQPVCGLGTGLKTEVYMPHLLTVMLYNSQFDCIDDGSFMYIEAAQLKYRLLECWVSFHCLLQ